MTQPTRAAISTASPYSTAAGARIARQGGNAVDIAAAAALAATVAEVLMCSLGGSAFFMIQLPGASPELIDGADMRPQASSSSIEESPAWRKVHIPYGDGIDIVAGHATVGVPGMLAAG